MSGRALTQLPQMSIMRYLEEGVDCDLAMAFDFMERSFPQTTTKTKNELASEQNTLQVTAKRDQKRKAEDEDEDDAELADAVGKLVSLLRKKRVKQERE